MPALCRKAVVGQAEYREVVGFRGAAGEEHLVAAAADERGDLITGLLHGLFGPSTELMRPAPFIPEFLDEEGADDVHDLRLEGGGGIAVEVDGHGKKRRCMFVI